MAISDWIGKTEEATDWVDPWRVRAIAATLGRTDISDAEGATLPTGWHWCLFPPIVGRDETGPDGHALRGGFLPPVELPRRMWAGGRIDVQRPLTVGEAVMRKSTIDSIVEKEGRSGPLVFVTVRHEFFGGEGDPAFTEEHDIVYRGPGGPASTPPPVSEPAVWSETVETDAVLLFRYSALTFNGHLIHYDVDYCRDVEGYPGLVVHGPLMATLLLGLAEANSDGRAIRHFSFRNISPVYAPDPITLGGRPIDDNTAELWVGNVDGGLVIEAKVSFAG